MVQLQLAGLELNVEVLPSVSRTLKFRFTARDNKANGAGNAYDDMSSHCKF